MKINTYLTSFRQDSIERQQWNPIRSLTPASLSRILDAFHAGQLKQAALVWDAIERRDDLLQGLISKRKKAISRLPWEILTLDNSDEARQQQEILKNFYQNLTCVNAYDENERGGLPLLIRQMMDAVGKKYAVHEIVFKPLLIGDRKLLTAEMRFVPLWFFENKNGHLHFVQANKDRKLPLTSGEWLTTTGDGLMESCSIAYLFKHLPLRDWLIYCERNGMPGVKGVTNAQPGSSEWEMAREEVKNFGAEFHALMSTGTDIQAIDISGRGELPYPRLVERMDRAMSALWRGSDLSTISNENGLGTSLQREEKALLEEDDARLISDTLHSQVDRYVLQHLCGTEHPKAYFYLKCSLNKNLNNDLALYKTLWEMGVPLSLNDLREHFGLPLPTNGQDCLVKKVAK